MTYAFTQDVPIDAAFYRRIVERLGDELPEGLLSHLVVEGPEGGLRYIDVWRSERDWDRFAEDRLHPVVHRLLEGVFGDQPPPEPERVVLPVIHHWGREPTELERSNLRLTDSAGIDIDARGWCKEMGIGPISRF